MTIQTKFHDTISIEDTDVLSFPEGIPGFEDEKEFVILELMDSYKVLQSVKNSWVAFIMVSPWTFEPNYEFDLSDSFLENLGVKNEEEILVYNLLTIPGDLKNATMNLVAPVVIHKEKKLGMQTVLQNTNYTTKHPIRIEGC